MKSKSSPAKKRSRPAPAAKGLETDDPSKMQLQIVEPRPISPISKSPTPFKLPRGWVVVERPRVNSPSHPGRVDRYYHEPGSGRQFRSLLAVQRYLRGDEEYTPTHQRVKPCKAKNSMQIVPRVFRSASSFKLPDDWIVVEKPRCNVNYSGVVDRYYIEPGTGHRFRSLIAVERYLKEMETSEVASEFSGRTYISGGDGSLQIVSKCSEDTEQTRALKLPGTGSWKKQKSISEVDPMLDFASPPRKVKWVLGGPGGSLWNPFMGESAVPGFIQQTWSEAFILSIQD